MESSHCMFGYIVYIDFILTGICFNIGFQVLQNMTVQIICIVGLIELWDAPK